MAYDKTSAGTGNWNTAGTWTPSGVPDPATQTINIAAGHTVTVDVDVDVGIKLYVEGTLTVPTGKTLSSTTVEAVWVDDEYVPSDITVTTGGILNIQSGGSFVSGGTAGGSGTYNFLDGSQNVIMGGTFQPSGTMNFADGSITTIIGGLLFLDLDVAVAGTIDMAGPSGGLTFEVTNTASLASTGSITVGPGTTLTNLATLTVDAGGALVLAGGKFDLSYGSLDLNEPLTTTAASEFHNDGRAITGLISATHAITWTGTGTLTVDSGGTLNLGGIASGLLVTPNPGAASTLSLEGTIHLGANITASGWTLAIGNASLIATKDLSINGDGATAITNTGGAVYPGNYTVAISNMDITGGTLMAIGCADGTGNTGVQFTRPVSIPSDAGKPTHPMMRAPK